MKRILSFLLSLVMVLGIFASLPITVSAAESGTFDDNLTWNIDDEGTLIVNGTGDMYGHSGYDWAPWYYYRDSIKNVVISEGVVSICNYAFYECTNLISITIPDSVTSIGVYAFYNCTSLISITIPDSVTSIGNYAFGSCMSLSSITIPDSVTSIGICAFHNTAYYNNNSSWINNFLYVGNHLVNVEENLSGRYAIKDGTKTIAGGAFSDCTRLTSITIPDSVTSIGYAAFYNCTSLKSITIPDSVTSIGSYAFRNTAYYKQSGNWENGVLYINNHLIEANTYIKGSYRIKNKTKTISAHAFAYCSFESITIPNSVVSIGEYAFYSCTSLVSIAIPDSVTRIGKSSFYNCASLKSIKIPDSVTSISDYAFCECASLTSITIPDSVTSIGNSAFSGCASLTSITIPDSVTSIGNSAFSGCASLTSITIPDDVTRIGKFSFYNCASLTSITIPDSVTSIGNSAFDNCASLTSITIPDSVTSIGEYAFDNCASLTSITIPDSVTSIGNSAFDNTAYYSNNSNWKNNVLYIGNHLIKAKETLSESYTIKDGTKTIAGRAFEGCTSLTSITIPDSVISIGDYAFYDCSSLQSVYITDVATWCNMDFYSDWGVGYGNPLYYAKNLYINGELVSNVVVPDGVLKIPEYAFSCENITSITIPGSVISIDDNAFYNCENLTSVEIADGVTGIGNRAFYNCTSLKSITIPDSVTSIGNETFYGCASLTSITIPDSVISIGRSAFSNCTSLKSITIPDSVTGISDYAFGNTAYYNQLSNWENDVLYIGNHLIEAREYLSGEYAIKDGTKTIADGAFIVCESLTSITIPDGVTSIGSSAFIGCASLTSITIPNSVTGISDYVFAGCTNLISIVIPDGTTNIGDGAFSRCTSLTSITIPNSVTNIGNEAFDNCTSLTSIIIPDSVRSIGTYALGYRYDENGEKLTVIKDFIIYGTKKSAAETYAKVNGLVFIDLNGCKHDTTKWVTDKKATVNAPGSKHQECTECGETLKTATIPQLKCATPKLKSLVNVATGVKFSWNKVTGADNYEIYRKTGKGKWTKIATVKGTVTSYTDKTAKSGTTYKYSVSAKNEAGSSKYNTTGLTIKCIADPVLKTPTSAKKGITLKWSKVTGAQGYVVYRKAGNGKFVKLTTVKGATKVSYVDKSAKKGTKYTYKLRAYSGKTYSEYSNGKTIKDKY